MGVWESSYLLHHHEVVFGSSGREGGGGGCGLVISCLHLLITALIELRLPMTSSE